MNPMRANRAKAAPPPASPSPAATTDSSHMRGGVVCPATRRRTSGSREPIWVTSRQYPVTILLPAPGVPGLFVSAHRLSASTGAHPRVQHLSQVEHPLAGGLLYLGPAAEAVRHQQRSRPGPLYGGQEVPLRHRHGDGVMAGLEAEVPGQAA